MCWISKHLTLAAQNCESSWLHANCTPPPPYLDQCLHLVQQDGFVAEVHQRFGDTQGERSQPGPVTPDQNQSLHASAVSNR